MEAAAPIPETPDRAWVARETNGHIRALATSLRDERPIGFFCECGCMGIAFRTLVEYEQAGGGWRYGHKPEEAPTPRSPTRKSGWGRGGIVRHTELGPPWRHQSWGRRVLVSRAIRARQMTR